MKKGAVINEGSIAYDILCYLERNPESQDSVQGIAHWWLLEQRIVNTLKQVQTALDELAAQDFLIIRQGLDGRVSYRLNPQARSKVRGLVMGRELGQNHENAE